MTLQINSNTIITQAIFDAYNIFEYSGTDVNLISFNGNNNGPMILNGNKTFTTNQNNSSAIFILSNNYSGSDFFSLGNYTMTFGSANITSTITVKGMDGADFLLNSNTKNANGGRVFVGGTIINYLNLIVSAGKGGNGSYYYYSGGQVSTFKTVDGGSANGGDAIVSTVYNYKTMNITGGDGGNNAKMAGCVIVVAGLGEGNLGNAGSAHGGRCIVGNLNNTGTMTMTSGAGGNSFLGTIALLNNNNVSPGTNCSSFTGFTAGNGGSANSGNCVDGTIMNSGSIAFTVADAGNRYLACGSTMNTNKYGSAVGGSANSGYAVSGNVTNNKGSSMLITSGKGGNLGDYAGSSFYSVPINGVLTEFAAQGNGGSAFCGGSINPDSGTFTNSGTVLINSTLAGIINSSMGGNTGEYAGFGKINGSANAMAAIGGSITNFYKIRVFGNQAGGNVRNTGHKASRSIFGSLNNQQNGIIYAQGGASSTYGTAEVGFYGYMYNYGFFKPTGGALTSSSYATNAILTSNSTGNTSFSPGILNICGGQGTMDGTYIAVNENLYSWFNGNCSSAPNPAF